MEKIIENREYLFKEKFSRILYCYPVEDRSIKAQKYIANLRATFETLEARHLNKIHLMVIKRNLCVAGGKWPSQSQKSPSRRKCHPHFVPP